MSFLFVGKGMFTESLLMEKLNQMGFSNPSDVIKEAKERKIAIRGKYKILAVIA